MPERRVVQRTLKNSAVFRGVGLHSGRDVLLRVLPAPANSGISFIRTDLPEGQNIIPARFDLVSDTRMNTRIANTHGAYVSTIEHLMAAFAGMGISNAIVEVNSPEVPVLDGSSFEFTNRFWEIGLEEQSAPARVFKVVKPVRVISDNGAYAELIPDDIFSIDMQIDFADPAIGVQSLALDMANGVFVRELANCRTFVRRFEVETLQENGLALGGSLQNAVVVEDGQVLNPEGFRRADECVRHKMLDALGDLYLAGGAIIGRYNGSRSGHALTNQLLRKAFSQSALDLIDADASVTTENLLPGYQLEAEDFAVA